jgi:DNA (cytosine-5)-methyltransferase 1
VSLLQDLRLTLSLRLVGVRKLRQNWQACKPKVIDLFAGVGGFSLGAIRAGFDVVAAIDLDKHAIASHKKNFPHATHRRRNVANLRGAALLEIAKLKPDELSGMIGGPPCQGFSRIGNRRKNDVRNSLFFQFFRLVSELQPCFFVAENVPGIQDDKYSDFLTHCLDQVRDDYHLVEPFELCASDFGAATNRTRVFFVGVHRLLGVSFSSDDFTPSQKVSKASVRRAFDGLPSVVDDSWQTEESSWREVASVDSSYAKLVNRRCGKLAGEPIALRRFEERLVSGWLGTRHEDKVRERFALVQAGQTEKTSRYPRLRWEGRCPTLRAGTDKTRGSFQAVRPIHPEEDRVIAPREAARLQGFPDWFQFSPTKWHSFRQIGNSVCPLVAEGVLKVIKADIF